jgi:hypothetical protein
MTDPAVEACRSAHAALGSRLVDLESDPNVALARSGALTGGTAATWAAADAGLSQSWEAFRVIGQLLDEVATESAPARAAARLMGAQVPLVGGDGQTGPPSDALTSAHTAIDEAAAVIHRLGAAWDRLATRVGSARAAASASGDSATERAANALAGLVTTDPFAVTEADVAAIEAKATASGSRHAAAQAASARFDIDLVSARDTLAALDRDAQAAAAELEHAASRIVGVSATVPVPDLAALGTWLDRIAATAAAGTDRTRAATDLAAWNAAAQARKDELDAALTPARDGLRRREEGRGLWTALRAKAGAHKRDEQPDVTEALSAARDLLWSAPCDLDAAEAALARLSGVLTKRPMEDR